MSTTPTPVRTAFLLCPSWHGATLLGMLLGNNSRAVSLGDTLHNAWPFPCRCGQRSDVCDFWRDVRARCDVKDGEPLPRRPRLLEHAAVDQSAVIGLSALARRCGLRPRAFAPTLATHRALHAAAYSRKAFELFIDGCKSPTRYAALRTDPELASAGIIHLVRDPRAFVAAARRHGMTTANAARSWTRYHRAIGPIARLFGDRVYTLRYEDLCADPARELERLQTWLGLAPESLLHTFDTGWHWTGSGSVTGFDGTLRRSERWRDELGRADLEVVRSATCRLAVSWAYDISDP